jgi:hypothetical protein
MASTRLLAAAAVALSISSLAAQERKPVPKDSVRVFLPGCTKGYVFTAGPRTVEEPIPEGMHIRMNGPKKMINEIKAHEGSMIELIGLMKKGQYREGVGIGGGVRVMPGQSAGGRPSPVASIPEIDVEGWRQIEGSCPSR